MTTTPQPQRPVLITIDADGGYIHCAPDQAPAELLEHALALAVTAITAAVDELGMHGDAATTLVQDSIAWLGNNTSATVHLWMANRTTDT